MSNIEIQRVGIYPPWEKAWKGVVKNAIARSEIYETKAVDEIEEYIKNGITKSRSAFELKYPTQPVNPPWRAWELSGVGQYLSMYGGIRLSAAEISSMLDKEIDILKYNSAFLALYTSEMIALFNQNLFQNRFDGKIKENVSNSIAYSALGYFIGRDAQAEMLARMQISAFKKGFYIAQNEFPIFHFMLRVLCQYLNEADIFSEGQIISEPSLQALFELWREPNPESLIEVGLAVCDFHTQRCRPNSGNASKNAKWFEFNNGEWTRTPIEILLLFRLRQNLGLSNPSINHPLMNTCLGYLPSNLACVPDELLSRARKRLIIDGYDESEIFNLSHD